MITKTDRNELLVLRTAHGTRLDRRLVAQCLQLSRARLQELIAERLALTVRLGLSPDRFPADMLDPGKIANSLS